MDRTRVSALGLSVITLGFAAGWWVSHGLVRAESSEALEAAGPSGQRRDPFIPLVKDGRLLSVAANTPRVSDVPLNLGGILWDPAGQSIALINDTELKAGDTIAGYRVTEIRQDAVVLGRGEQSVVLQIAFDEPVKPKHGTQSYGGR